MSKATFHVLEEFGNQWSAVTIQNLLAAAGIDSHVHGTDPAAALSMGGAPTNSLVRLQVAEKDYRRARAVLIEHEEELAGRQPWLCDRCEEPNGPGFEFCWNCDAGRSERSVPDTLVKINADLEPVRDADSPYSVPLTVPLANSQNPYRPVDTCNAATIAHPIADSEDNVVAYETAVRRSLLASITSLIIFPPLVCFLAVYLLCNLPPRPPSVRFPAVILRTAWGFTALGFLLGCFWFWVSYPR